MKLFVYIVSVLMMTISFNGCGSNESKVGNMDLGVCTNPKCECPKPCQCGSGCRCGMGGNAKDLSATTK